MIFKRQLPKANSIRTIKKFAFLPTPVSRCEGLDCITHVVWLTTYYAKEKFLVAGDMYMWCEQDRFLIKEENSEDHT